jgi:hypothetical protein
MVWLQNDKNAWDQHKSQVQRQGTLKYYSEAQQHTRSKNEAKERMYDVSEARSEEHTSELQSLTDAHW